MGNRGVLHDGERRIVRYAQVRRWIACALEFRGRHRSVMAPNRYTELFFLDEVTAFAAGHRPCAECRNADYERFCAYWARAHAGRARADEIDRALDGERRVRRSKRIHRAAGAELPDGAFVALDGAAWLLLGNAALGWSDAGYGERRARPRGAVELLTPPAIVAVLRAGYVPAYHPSASPA